MRAARIGAAPAADNRGAATIVVGVSVRLSDAVPAYSRECASSTQSVEQCRIDGDFFLDGDDKDSRRLLRDLENLLQSQQSVSARDITRRLQAITANYPNVRLVGMTEEGIAIAFLRAITSSESRNAEDATNNGNIARSTKQYSGKQPEMHNALTQEEYLERWRVLKPTVIHDKPRNPNYEFAARLLVQSSAHQSWSSWPRPSLLRFE